MRTKLLTLGLICLLMLGSGCKKQLPTSPDIPDVPEPDPTDVFYSCNFQVTVSHDASATGDFYISLLEETPTGNPQLMSLGDLNFSPLPNNPDVSEGTVSFLETIPAVPSGTYVLCLHLVHYNDLEQYQVTPGEWVIEATISEGFEFLTGGVFTSVRYALVQVGRDTAWLTFSISE